MGESEIKGLWSLAESGLHINLLELRAIRLVLKAFLHSLKGKVVQVFTDNSTAMWYSNKQGGVGSWTLCQEALRHWTWLEHQGINLIVQHLAGSLNARADELSRRCTADREWHLHPEVAQVLFQQWGEPWLDLFTSTENAQCQLFCTLEFPRRHSLGDAFRLEWNSGLLSAYTSSAQSSQENQERLGPSHLGSSRLGTESMVSRAIEHVHRSSTQTTSSGGSSVAATGDGSSPKTVQPCLHAWRLSDAS
ncbi:hypothetical protein NDU88_004587 [Pleurodeles waltl]|uniref:Reverse transcriptase RNase H-like domain-containing protein n=1 Tax=Pleurodeles waltl TaxID=8319 RepID=A0AAV7QCR6_PLEWA|nr:hypothetical protein NDU88_004587 [Pleurodeles waltl]